MIDSPSIILSGSKRYWFGITDTSLNITQYQIGKEIGSTEHHEKEVKLQQCKHGGKHRE